MTGFNNQSLRLTHVKACYFVMDQVGDCMPIPTNLKIKLSFHGGKIEIHIESGKNLEQLTLDQIVILVAEVGIS